MAIRFAFAGFRHGHIFSLLEKVRQAEDAVLVAACEEDEATRAELQRAGTVAITHDSLDALLADCACDVIAIGDCYGRRGALAARALESGRHVILDKPICTSLEELDRLERLARERGLAVGCQLDMRANPARMTMRRLILDGEIGEVLTIAFGGQHPLLPGRRPAWYFEPGMHGGTINDIAIHAMDWIPWATGREIVEVVAARTWNAKTPDHPWFRDCAQMMLRLDNGGGVLGDVSYLMPDGCGYAVRQYWRVTIHGSEGLVETQCGDPDVYVATHADKEPRLVPGEHDGSQDYFRDFLDEVRGREVPPAGLTTGKVLRAARLALTAQHAADNDLVHVPCA
jgi:predicted dehydrogenase